MANVEFSDEIRDRILYHWAELGDRPRVIWRRLQDEGFNVDWHTVEALMRCEPSDDESTAAETLAEHYDTDSRNGGASVSGLFDENSLNGSDGLDRNRPTSKKCKSSRERDRDKNVATPPNRRTKLTPDVLSLIENILDTDGSIYSLAALQAALAVKGVKISKTTTFRALEKLGRSIVVKKMICSNNRPPAPPATNNRPLAPPATEAAAVSLPTSVSAFASSRQTMQSNVDAENKRRVRALTIREMETAAAAVATSVPYYRAHPKPADQRIAASSAIASPRVSPSSTSSHSRSAASTPTEPLAFPPPAPGARMGTDPSTNHGATSSLVLPPKKKAMSAASLNLVLGHGGVTSYTSAPLDERVKDSVVDSRPRSREEEPMDLQETPSTRDIPPSKAPIVKKEIMDEDDFEVKVDEYDMGDDDVNDHRRRDKTSTKDRDGSKDRSRDGSVSTPSPRPRSNDGKVLTKPREKLSVPIRPWLKSTSREEDVDVNVDGDDDDEAAIFEAREIARRRLSHTGDQPMLGSDEELDSEHDLPVNPKRPRSLERSSAGSAQSAGSHGSQLSHRSQSSHGSHTLNVQHQESHAKSSGRSSSTLTSHSGSSCGSGGIDRCQRSPGASAASAGSAESAAAMAAAGMAYPGPQLTFHRSQMCNAAAMASRLAAAHGLAHEMGQPFHVGQRRLPLSAGRGGVKQPFMSKFQRNLAGARQGMASGMPRRMQRMAAAAAAAGGFPPSIPHHKMHKMMRMRQQMGKAMWGLHHGGHGHGRGGGGGRFHGDFNGGRHGRNRQFAAAYAAAAAAQGQQNAGAEDVSPELEIDPPETYGEFAERIFAARANQRESESPPENADVRKWMEDISHRLSSIENQLQLVIEHLPFVGGAEIHSVSTDHGGGSEVDSGLQEDSVPGSGGGGGGSNNSGGAGGGGGRGAGGGSAGSNTGSPPGNSNGSTGGKTGSSNGAAGAGGSNEGSSMSRQEASDRRGDKTTERAVEGGGSEKGDEGRDVEQVRLHVEGRGEGGVGEEVTQNTTGSRVENPRISRETELGGVGRNFSGGFHNFGPRHKDRGGGRPILPFPKKARMCGPGYRGRMDSFPFTGRKDFTGRGHLNERGHAPATSGHYFDEEEEEEGDRREREAPLDDSYSDVMEDKSVGERFDDQDSMSEFGEQPSWDESHMEARIDMVMQDTRWDGMTPYAGAPRMAIALARYCIFGTRVLIRSSVTGRGQKNPLDFAGMRKIKQLLFQKYGARCSPIEFEVIWKTSRESISQLCKRLRRKFGAYVAGNAQLQEDFMVDFPLLS